VDPPGIGYFRLLKNNKNLTNFEDLEIDIPYPYFCGRGAALLVLAVFIGMKPKVVFARSVGDLSTSRRKEVLE
jgi:predicted nicotinamide N-methyase